jgi:excisionase family DNA binding protein
VAEKDQFFSFEEALKELRLKEEELKRLVSEGEIRAFREGETMKLRRADVENLRNELSGGEVVDLGDVREELVFEDDTLSDEGMATQEIGMATEEISEVETIVDEGVEDVGEVTVEETVVEETTEDGVPVETAVRRTVRVEEVPEENEGAGIRALVLTTTLILILAIPVCIAVSSGIFSSVATTVSGIFGK